MCMVGGDERRRRGLGIACPPTQRGCGAAQRCGNLTVEHRYGASDVEVTYG